MKQELTPAEHNDINVLVSLFKSDFHGIGNAIKTADILKHLAKSGQTVYSPQTLRKYLGEIRKHDMLTPGFIVSDVHLGYWYATEKNELSDFVEKQLNRMANQYENVSSLHRRMRTLGSQITSLQTSIVF